ncbi:unnamed protein product [Penicillium olsonii]|uniref:ABM domain-containing protein n=1 Tax=Penicillium olsonii TaxID=99116 RepID=A0A9W4HVD2_PENOL|nr:unnamed protein product [Penicillium olsonii]CAG8153739.1 unnamed protein product [Penicillium olsonii]
MAVTEVALIRLKSDLPPTAKANLLEAQKAQEDYSKHAVHFLNQTTDRSFYYLVGGWESVEKHTHEWIQSETNQRLLGLLGQDFDVCWMFHLDIDPSVSKLPLDAPVIMISRYFVEADKKDVFDAAFKASEPQLAARTAPFSYCGGWRIDRDGEGEEFVLFSGWPKTQDQFEFAESAEFMQLGKIKDWVRGAEIKNTRLENWE